MATIHERLRRLEAHHTPSPAHTVQAFRMLKSCYAVLSRWDEAPMPADTELWAMAEADAAPPDFTAAVQRVWAAEGQR